MTVSLTDIETQRILDACLAYIDLMGQGEDTHDYTIYELETGLGSALRKIGKGRNAQRVYANYKTVTNYPTFDEWKAARADRTESETDNEDDN